MKTLAERVAADPKVQDVFTDNTCGCLRVCDAAMIQPIIDAVMRELSSARVTVDPQILIDARVEFAALYECTSAYRGDRLPIKRDGVGEIFERANKMIGRLDAVIADLPKE